MLAAYGCLAPRLVTGEFDPTRDRAVWPSTGNYCRGGVAISRLMGCRGVAVLPEGMSRERFALARAAGSPTRPTSSARPAPRATSRRSTTAATSSRPTPTNVIFNQFSEFGNYVVHYLATGRALERVFEHAPADEPRLRLRAFVSATGSAGTIGAGDYLKERLGSLIVAAEALECPTMLENGFGEHNIQGIGDKHIPLIHNVLNTDVALAVSDRATDRLGRALRHGDGPAAPRLAAAASPRRSSTELPSLGLSSICNVLGAIKTAKHFGLGAATT